MAQTGIPAWSKTAASNATADGNINWAEGQAPSSVNDSARAMMAAVAKWRDDNSGSLTTGGTSTAYTVTTNQVFDSLSSMSGQTIRLKFHATNGASPTLNVDGLGAKSIIVASGTAVPASFVATGCIYSLYYDNSIPGWICVDSQYQFFQAGTRMLFANSSAPSGWSKDTSNDNMALRLVSGSGGGTGGSSTFTSVFASRTIAQANLPNVSFTVTIPAGQGSHSHGHNAIAFSGFNGQGTSGLSFGAATINTQTLPEMTGTAASGGSGTALDFAVAYLDVISCTKL